MLNPRTTAGNTLSIDRFPLPRRLAGG